MLTIIYYQYVINMNEVDEIIKIIDKISLKSIIKSEILYDYRMIHEKIRKYECITGDKNIRNELIDLLSGCDR